MKAKGDRRRCYQFPETCKGARGLVFLLRALSDGINTLYMKYILFILIMISCTKQRVEKPRTYIDGIPGFYDPIDTRLDSCYKLYRCDSIYVKYGDCLFNYDTSYLTPNTHNIYYDNRRGRFVIDTLNHQQ
jgi:hypothetical protein